MTQDISKLLEIAQSDDNEVRDQAEEQLDALLQTPQGLLNLLTVLKDSQTNEGQQILAAILLKKYIGTFLKRMSKDETEYVKVEVLTIISQVQATASVNSLADVVGIIVSQPDAAWPQLLDAIRQLAGSTSENHQLAALKLFQALCEFVGQQARNLQSSIVMLVSTCLANGSPRVKAEAVQLYEHALALTQDASEMEPFKNLLPEILKVSEGFIQAGEVEFEAGLLTTLGDVIEESPKLINNHLQLIVGHMTTMLAAQSVAPHKQLRMGALEVLKALVRKKPKTLKGSPDLSSHIIQAALALTCDEPPSADAGGDVETPLSICAAQVLDTAALSLPSKNVYPVVSTWVQGVWKTGANEQRRGSLLAAGYIADGCAKQVGKEVRDWMGLVVEGLKNRETEVAAAIALHNFSIYLHEALVPLFDTVLQLIFHHLDTALPRTRELLCMALGAICENMTRTDLRPYLNNLMNKLGEVLQLGGGEGAAANADLLDAAVSAVSSVAIAAAADFAPYAGTTLQLLGSLLEQPDAALLDVRTRAVECLGHVAEAAGPGPTSGPALHLLSLALPGLNLGYLDLKVAIFEAAAAVAPILQQQMEPTVPYLVPVALESLKAVDGMIEQGEAGGEEEATVSVRTGAIEEKASAMECLGALAKELGAGVGGYLEQIVIGVKGMATHFHERVREEACRAMGSLLLAAHAVKPPATGQALSSEVGSLYNDSLATWLNAARTERSKPVVAAVFQGLAATYEGWRVQTWPSVEVLKPGASEVANVVRQTLAGDTLPCMAVKQAEEEGEEYDDHDADCELLEAACTLLPHLALLLKPAFATTHMPTYHAQLMQYLSPQLTPEQVNIALGAVADFMIALEEHCTPFINDQVLSAVSNACSSPDSDSQQNGVYTVYAIASSAPIQMVRDLKDKLLYFLDGPHECEAIVSDNLCFAKAQLIARLGPELDLVAATQWLCKLLPLKEDYTEASAVARGVGILLTDEVLDKVPAECAPRLIEALIQAYNRPNVRPDARQEIAKLVAHVSQAQQGSKWVGRLGQSHTEGLQAILGAK